MIDKVQTRPADYPRPPATYCLEFDPLESPALLSVAQIRFRCRRKEAHAPPRLSPPHIRRDHPCKYWTSAQLAASSQSLCLLCDFCSSVQRFAYGFLQTPPREGRPCFRLALPLTGCAGDFNPQVRAPCRAHQQPVSFRASPKRKFRVSRIHCYRPNQRARRLEPKCSLSARMATEGS